MNNFCQYIEQLLIRHDYVIVPDLGGFFIHTQSASLLADRIIPPVSVIGFNSLVQYPDGLLTIEVVHSEGISYQSALTYISDKVDEIKNELFNSGSFQFGRLGTMRHDADGSIIFLPNTSTDFLSFNFGLEELHITARNYVNSEPEQTLTITLPKKKTYRYVAAAMLIFSFLLISPRTNDIKQVNSADLSNLFTMNRPLNVEDSTAVIEDLVDIEDNYAVGEEKKFHVIFASLPDRKSADKYYEMLVNKGFVYAHVLPPTRIYKVAVQSFSDRNEAIVFMESLRQSDACFQNAWVFCE